MINPVTLGSKMKEKTHQCVNSGHIISQGAPKRTRTGHKAREQQD